MKKVIFLLGFVVGCVIINAQVPQDFNYQAIVCNAAGESTPKYQWSYDGNESNVATFGR